MSLLRLFRRASQLLRQRPFKNLCDSAATAGLFTTLGFTFDNVTASLLAFDNFSNPIRGPVPLFGFVIRP